MGADLDPQFRPPPEAEPAIRALCEQMLPVIRQAARARGYAIGLHGSMVRDLDLIAAPWVEDASEPRELVAAIVAALQAHFADECIYGGLRASPTPHGRLWANIYFGGEVGVATTAGCFPFVDLSIMPRLAG